MAKACRCKSAECEECPEWIFTFADLVMLMMGFFVILWVLKPNPTPEKKHAEDENMVKVAAQIRAAFGYIPNPQSKDPVDIEMLMHRIKKIQLDGNGDGGTVDRPRRGPEGLEDETTSIRLGKYATEGGKLTFDVGSAALSNDAKGALADIASLIRGHRNLILVKGHTALDEVENDAQGALALSLRRAEAAANFLQTQGVDPALIRVQGCSSYEPVVRDQYGMDGLRPNRRVEVEAMSTLLDDLQAKRPVIPSNDPPSVQTPSSAP